MKYLIVEPKVKAIAPSLALMKWARWCESKGYKYQYVRGQVDPDIIPDKILMSCIFSYNSKLYENTMNHYLNKFPKAKFTVGGVFPSLNPDWFKKLNGAVRVHKGLYKSIEKLVPKYDVKIKSEDTNPYPRDKIVLYASRGCPNRCQFCGVPKLEGSFKPFKSIKGILNKAEIPNASSVVLYDNNFTEHPYFDKIVDELLELNLPVDIHGLHVDSFTRHHAIRFSELQWRGQGENGTAYLRFSFDKLKYADGIRKAFRYVIEEDVKAQFFCYLMFNWLDTPEDFWQRIQLTQEIVDEIGETIFLFPQRYEPLNALERNQFIGKHWNEIQVKGLVRLYTELRGFIPITRSRSIYDWIGHTKEEFFQKVNNLGIDNKSKIIKMPVPKTDQDLSFKFHPVSGIFPMMNDEEFEGLKSDIERHGQLEPIWTLDGKIIDGRNRYLACQQLGIKPKLKQWKPENGNELVDFVISLNLKRRHLNASQKALVAVDALPYYEEVAKKRQKLSKGRGKKGRAKVPHVLGRSRDIAAKIFGVSGRYVGYAKTINKKNPELAQEIRDGKKNIKEAINQIQNDERINKLSKVGKKYNPQKPTQIICADFYKWCIDNLKNNSIDLILTNPPNTQNDFSLWEKFTEQAARVLKPSRFLIAFCNQRYLDKVFQILSNHLNYHWMHCISLNVNGNGNKEHDGVIEKWQPVLVYVKNPQKNSGILKNNSDRTAMNTNQDYYDPIENGIRYLIDVYSNRNDLVFDPFLGNGEVLRVSKSMNRNFIGIDIDSDRVEIANTMNF